MIEKPTKPAYGAPACNGCGVCCQRFLCPLASMVFGDIDGPCPALEDIGDRYTCGLVEHPNKYAPLRAAIVGAPKLSAAARLVVGVGVGCDTQDDNEPDNPDYRIRMRDGRKGIPDDAIAKAIIAWLGATARRKVAEFQGRVQAL